MNTDFYYFIKITNEGYEVVDSTQDEDKLPLLGDLHNRSSGNIHYVNRNGEEMQVVNEEREVPCITVASKFSSPSEVLEELYLKYPAPSMLYRKINSGGKVCYL